MWFRKVKVWEHPLCNYYFHSFGMLCVLFGPFIARVLSFSFTPERNCSHVLSKWRASPLFWSGKNLCARVLRSFFCVIADVTRPILIFWLNLMMPWTAELWHLSLVSTIPLFDRMMKWCHITHGHRQHWEWRILHFNPPWLCWKSLNCLAQL